MPPTVNHTLCYSRLEFSSPFFIQGTLGLTFDRKNTGEVAPHDFEV